MKSSGFGWDAPSAVELLAASFLADDEFCANAELVAANAINQFTRQSPVPRGVKCHVTWLVMNKAIAFFKKMKANLFRLRAEVCDLHSLAFVVVSGTAVAPTESCELSRFEIP